MKTVILLLTALLLISGCCSSTCNNPNQSKKFKIVYVVFYPGGVNDTVTAESNTGFMFTSHSGSNFISSSSNIFYAGTAPYKVIYNSANN